jgi:hypothetical protein
VEEKGREEGRVVRVGRKEAGVKSRDEAEQSWVGEVGRERERQRRRDGGGGGGRKCEVQDIKETTRVRGGLQSIQSHPLACDSDAAGQHTTISES